MPSGSVQPASDRRFLTIDHPSRALQSMPCCRGSQRDRVMGFLGVYPEGCHALSTTHQMSTEAGLVVTRAACCHAYRLSPYTLSEGHHPRHRPWLVCESIYLHESCPPAGRGARDRRILADVLCCPQIVMHSQGSAQVLRDNPNMGLTQHVLVIARKNVHIESPVRQPTPA